MAKSKAKATAAKSVAAAKPVVPAQGSAQIIASVKAGVKFRGARAAWYAVLQQYQGKSVAAFYAATSSPTGKPPSMPKSNIPEAPTGWLSYFVRTQVCTLK